MRKIITVFTLSLLSINIIAQDAEYKSQETCPFQITNYEPITLKGERYTLPQISPDGTKVLFTKSGKKGVYIVDLKSKGQIINIAEEPIYGNTLKWSKSGDYITYKTRGNRKSKTFAENTYKYSIANAKNEILTSKDQEIEISLNVRARKVEAFDGTNRWFITKEPGSYYNLLISPDNSKVIIKDDHIYIYSIDGNEIIDTGLERGIVTDWSPDGKYFLYFVANDDGHNYIESDLYVCSIDGKNNWRLTSTDDVWEAKPTWSINGEKISFVDYKSGKIYVADLKTK